MTTERRIPIKTINGGERSNLNVLRESNNNGSLEEDAEDNLDGGRKLSYVGLSCAVSGYSSFIRYTSPSRKTSPPQQFHVASEPQILDVQNYNFNMRPEAEAASRPVRGQAQNGGSSFDATDFYPSTQSRKVVEAGGVTTVETVTKFYNHNNNGSVRETSPGSDTSSVGSSGGSTSCGGSGGTLIQKQIERLYGSKVQTVRILSPEPKSSEDSSPETDLNGGGGFFAKRFGIIKQKDRHSPIDHTSRRLNGTTSNSDQSGGPLELKTLKIPAVFRLLRPEFREQLKSNSCQVKIPSESSPSNNLEERVIPINVKNGTNLNGPKSNEERLIPVVRDDKPFNGRHRGLNHNNNNNDTPVTSRTTSRSQEKPALPAKPMSPTRSPRSPPLATSPTPMAPQNLITNPVTPPMTRHNLITQSPVTSPTTKAQDNLITSPTLVSSLIFKSPEHEQLQDEMQESVPSREEEFEDEEEDEVEEEELVNDQYPCGLRERSLLCPIQEEDTESTTSASSLSVVAKKSSSSVINADESNAILEEVHDGHYFIKMLENEIFKFEEQICDFEEVDLSHMDPVPVDIEESLFTAIGKAKLLMAQKLMQFRGLCDKNIASNLEKDPFVPTSEDLAGFWDMVYIQVEHIHSLFAELTVLRENGWKRVEEPKANGNKKPSSSPQKTKTKRASPGSGGKPVVKSEAAKARDEARRKLLEEKKRQMKEQKKKTESGTAATDSNELFVQF